MLRHRWGSADEIHGSICRNSSAEVLPNLRFRRLRLRKRTNAPACPACTQRSTMTTSPDTVHATGAAPAARPSALTDQAPAPGGTLGGAVRTQPRTPRPDFEDEPSSSLQRFMVGLFVAVPLVALVAAIPLLWGWGLGWHDVVIALVFYWVSGLGVTVGYHRYFTHGSFKAKTGLRVRAGHRGQPGHRGAGHHLGVRPPPAPQVQRPGRRPALAVALRGRLEGADQGPGVRARGLALRPQQDLAGEVLARPARGPADPAGGSLVPGAGGGLAAAPRADRRAVGDCPGRAR